MQRSLAARLRQFEKAKQELIAMARMTQLNCPHAQAWETGYVSGSTFSCGYNARRLCADCGLEEVGTAHSGFTDRHWYREGGGEALLAKARILEILPRDEFYAKRLPVYTDSDLSNMAVG